MEMLLAMGLILVEADGMVAKTTLAVLVTLVVLLLIMEVVPLCLTV